MAADVPAERASAVPQARAGGSAPAAAPLVTPLAAAPAQAQVVCFLTRSSCIAAMRVHARAIAMLKRARFVT